MRTQRSREAEVGGEAKDMLLLSLNCHPRPTSASLRLCVRVDLAQLTEVDVGLPGFTAVDRFHDCAKRTQSTRRKRIPGTALRYAPGRGAGSCATGAAPGIGPMCGNVRERAARIETRETNPIEAIAKPRFQATGQEMCHFGALAADETKPTAVWARWGRASRSCARSWPRVASRSGAL